MLSVYDLNLKKTAELENAFDIIESEVINGVSTLSFSLPATDPKNQYCALMCYVRFGDGQLYRITAPQKHVNDISVMTYECEHVIATLIDDVLFGQHVVGNIGTYTRDCINYVLSKQTVRRWEIKDCDFARQFEYGWEHENLLVALGSIPNLFVDKYMWDYDTASFPWQLSLKWIDEAAKPEFYIRAGKNLLAYEENGTALDICTRLYCLGYGEGVNQLTIAGVNGGVPYIQSPQSYIDRYGLITRIFVDRRFEDAQSLLERGRALLAKLQEPVMTKTVEAIDLYPLTNDDLDNAKLGKIVMLADDGTKTYITAITRNHSVPGDMTLTLATAPVDIAGSIADLADRQRIESVYAQGATQLYALSVQANATTDRAAKLNFYIPADMRIVNKVEAKISLASFRSYSKATAGGGAVAQTTQSGGGTSTSTAAGGATQATSDTDYPDPITSSTPVYVVGQDWLLHWHIIDQTPHSHNIAIPQHQHGISIPAHQHDLTIPEHTHDIEQGIFEFGSPTGASISVNGTLRADMERDIEIDITDYLVGSNGIISRGTWHTVEIKPNDSAYVTIDIYIQGFIQSREEATY